MTKIFQMAKLVEHLFFHARYGLGTFLKLSICFSQLKDLSETGKASKGNIPFSVSIICQFFACNVEYNTDQVRNF